MTGCVSKLLSAILLSSLAIPALPVQAQLEPEPHPLDTFLQSILDFRQPTGIRGIIRFIDKDEQIVWLNWEQRSDDRPLFQGGWNDVPGEATLAVHPQDSSQISQLQAMSAGTSVEMVIQLDQEGRRRILTFRDRSVPPKVPL